MRVYGGPDPNFWRDYVIDKLENAVQAEIKKLDTEREEKGSLAGDEDEWVTSVKAQGDRKSPVKEIPGTWRTCYDHLLPGWHDEWCNLDNLSMAYWDWSLINLPRDIKSQKLLY